MFPLSFEVSFLPLLFLLLSDFTCSKYMVDNISPLSRRMWKQATSASTSVEKFPVSLPPTTNKMWQVTVFTAWKFFLVSITKINPFVSAFDHCLCCPFLAKLYSCATGHYTGSLNTIAPPPHACYMRLKKKCWWHHYNHFHFPHITVPLFHAPSWFL